MTDLSLLHFFNDFVFRSPALDALILFSAVFLGYWMVLGVIVLAGATLLSKYSHIRRKNIEIAIVSLASAFIARYALTELIRFFYSRPRPFEIVTDVHQLLFRESGGSFPSGHAAFFFALATVVAFYYPKTGILFFAAAILMGAARVAVGVHWPSDIVGGAIIGIIVGILAIFLTKRYRLLPR